MNCGNCEHKRKIRTSTYYECLKYGDIITTSPPQRCEKCLKSMKKAKTGKNKDYIEVK